MSKLGLVIVIALMAGRINAQNYPAPASEPLTYFVLIQADSGQAFYIRLDSQLYPSSPVGHLILAQLKDSAYPITVGFPGQVYPEQRYLLNIHQKDQALRLSREDNSWRLLDAQGQQMPAVVDPAAAEMPLLAGAKKDDAFSQLMAAIVRDTAVMYNTYAASSDSTQPASLDSTHPVSLDSAHPVSLDSTHPASSDSVRAWDPAIPSAPTGVVKLSEHKSTKSLSLVYIDHTIDKKTDTIDVIIPVDTKAVVVRPRTKPTRHYPYTDTSRGLNSDIYTTYLDSNHYTVSTYDHFHVERVPKASSDTTRLGPQMSGRAPKTDTSAKVATTPRQSSLPFVNSDCHAFATDNDVDKLRVRMVSASKDDDRLLVAYRIFKTKCFTTSQVSALCAVFETDAAKFKFLEEAYPFVSDDRFPELVDLLSDSVYVGRFRTLTGRH